MAAIRPAAIAQYQTAAASTATHELELAPATNHAIQVTEVGISHDGPPNATDTPPEWQLERRTATGTGGASLTLAKMQSQMSNTLDATAKSASVNFTAKGGSSDSLLNRWFVPIISGMIWVAAPGREVDCGGTLILILFHAANLPTSRKANVYMVFEE